MEKERYVFKCEIVDTENDEVLAHGSIELPNKPQGNYNSFSTGKNEWFEDDAEGTFWDTMRNFRRAQAEIEVDENSVEEETI